MAVAINVPNISEPLRTLSDWLSEPETQRWMADAATDSVDELERSISDDKTLRTPRQLEERADGFRLWLHRYDESNLNAALRGYRFQMALQFQQEFERRFPLIYRDMENQSVLRDTFLKLVWPALEMQFRDRAHHTLAAYAVRSLVLSYLGRKIGDCLLVGIPVRTNANNWSVAVFSSASRALIADVQVDADGNVTTETEELLQKVDAALK